MDIPRKAAVLGSPVGHSRSPDLHRAAYAALGLADWTYEAIETTAEDLPGLVSAAGPEWIGFSVTMPGKLAALDFADERTERAELIGSANTLVRLPDGRWRADCTDIDGMTGALNEAQVPDGALRAVVVGAGGTALPTIAALAEWGITELAIVARSSWRAADAVALAHRLGMNCQVLGFENGPELAEAVAQSDVVISTVPAEATGAILDSLRPATRLIDVIYAPWPTPLAQAVAADGGIVVGGLVMLLNQAYSQVEQFTGRPAPREAMAAALAAAGTV
ncbi:shikimate dehydrogenase [Gordonia hirsuta DSM 44140 = NBRC 16056]|uniref:shikimate dehydrogenase (NADP(+)) n=1 Tax=Gordonia hirsuta DSM 44140 = NBRC 16056 TaxID=1121927 RepID=L7LBC4_9ACTN|nr:shikimate dehydrogenase [Gordonia hirsuta]GAC57343.1 shikimate dehydrogenase [Gordonia hirsuta DSM 44140 = NBRC 16056]